MLASFVAAALWLFPSTARPLLRDRNPRAIAQRFQAAVSFDNDIAAIADSASKANLRDAARWFFTGDWLDARGAGPRWRPLASCFWWLEYQAFKTDLALYNVVTLLMVAICCCLLAGAVAALSRSVLVGAAAAGFFLWKVAGELGAILVWFPAQIDVLAGAWLAASLYLLAVGVEAAGRRRSALIGCSLACYVAAVLSKEAALFFPIVAWAALWLRLRPVPGHPERPVRVAEGRRGGLCWMAAYGLAALLLLAARTSILGGAGPFLVRLDPAYLLARAVYVLFGVRFAHGTEWPALGGAILAAALFFAANWPHLARRRLVAYGMVLAVPALLAMAAKFTMGSPYVLTEGVVWKQIAAPCLLLFSGALVFRWRRADGIVFACLILAASVQLVLVPDWQRVHYYYLPAMAWAAMDAAALAAAWDCLRASTAGSHPDSGGTSSEGGICARW